MPSSRTRTGTSSVARHWKRLADPDGPDPTDPTNNRASITRGWDDRWHLEADLDPTSGAIVHATLQAITDRMHSDGHYKGRTVPFSQQQAEALVEMATRSTAAWCPPERPLASPSPL